MTEEMGRTCMILAMMASPEGTMGVSAQGRLIARVTVMAVAMGGWPRADAMQKLA
jgi:hypothetical protein